MEPIIYKATVQSRFSDLDPYGHVNTKHYFDYVVDSRLRFLADNFKLDLAKIAQTGFGFYATRCEINFLRPINGMRTLSVESFVESIINEVTMVIPFKIIDTETGKTNSDGKIHYANINLATGKPAPMNAELNKLFYK